MPMSGGIAHVWLGEATVAAVIVVIAVVRDPVSRRAQDLAKKMLSRSGSK